MTILVTGATGFVGKALLERLGYENTVVLGRDKPTDFPSERFYKAEVGSSTDYSNAMKGVEVIVHLAARVHVMQDHVNNPLDVYREVNTYGTVNLARQAAIAGVKRFVFVSSIKVNGEGTLLDEAFRAGDMQDPKDYYGQSKAEAENELLVLSKETGMEVVIVRPTLVYGPGVKANFASLMSLVSKGVPLPFLCIRHNRRSLVSIANLVDLLLICLEHPKAANNTFLVSDDHDVSTSEMVYEIAKALGRSNFQLPVPIWCYKIAGKIFKRSDVVDRLIGSLQVDIKHTKETLNWAPPQTLQDGFRQTAEAFLKSEKNKGKL